MSDEKRPVPAIVPAIQTISPVVAPLTLALTGMMYLAGWSEKTVVLFHYGIPTDYVSESIQSTLARGFGPLVLVTFALGLVAVISYPIIKWAWSKVPEQIKRDEPVSPDQPFKQFTRQSKRWFDMLAGAYAVLIYAVLAGALLGGVRISDIKDVLRSGCHRDCFVYVIGDERVVGRLVEGDSERIIIATASGTRIIEATALRATYRYTPGK